MDRSNGNSKKDAACVLLTVSGMLASMAPARDRPGCILEMGSGSDVGYYYIPLSPHDCRTKFPEGTRVTFQVRQDARPDKNGIIDTAGDASRLWEIG